MLNLKARPVEFPPEETEVRASGRSVEIQDLSAWYGQKLAIEKVTMSVAPNKVTAIIGPSGCGKSTLIRCINRMHEVIPGARLSGRILLDGEEICCAGMDPVLVRRRIGMVFQKPNPFPTMSIFDNVAAGLKLNGLANRRTLPAIVEKSLQQAALWDEVKD